MIQVHVYSHNKSVTGSLNYGTLYILHSLYVCIEFVLSGCDCLWRALRCVSFIGYGICCICTSFAVVFRYAARLHVVIYYDTMQRSSQVSIL